MDNRFCACFLAALIFFCAPLAASADERRDTPGLVECRKTKPEFLLKPSVSFFKRERARNVLGSQEEQVSGTIEGVCLIEAGYFEDGRKISDIPVVTLRDFRRFEFSTKVNLSKGGEIRAYNVNGLRESQPVLAAESAEQPGAAPFAKGEPSTPQRKGSQDARPGINSDGSFKDEMFFGR
jgi:hypothetical protein